jgi:hypothetical protein
MFPSSTSSIRLSARFRQEKAVYWQTGRLAYALTGAGSDKAIEGRPSGCPANFSNPANRRP